MRDVTFDLLRRFEANDWFANAGKPFNDKRVKRVPKWLDAVAHLTDGCFEVVGYECGIALEKAVGSAGERMAKRWKEAHEELRPLARALVTKHIVPSRERKSWSIYVDMIADYDISYALLEAEFDDLVAPGFFTEKARWYLAGRLPCGVTSRGKLCVY